jgi:hypothetical protein
MLHSSTDAGACVTFHRDSALPAGTAASIAADAISCSLPTASKARDMKGSQHVSATVQGTRHVCDDTSRLGAVACLISLPQAQPHAGHTQN